MKKLILLFLIALSPVSFPAILDAAQNKADEAKLPAKQNASTPSKPGAGEQHEFTIPSFKTESGAVLPQARVVYGTYGHLNAARDNVILLPSHYMADFH